MTSQTRSDQVSLKAAAPNVNRHGIKSGDGSPVAAAAAGPATAPKVVVVDRRPRTRGRTQWITERVRGNAHGFRKLDRTLLFAALALSFIGAMLVWSATRARLIAADDDSNSLLIRHLLNLVIGISLGWVVTRVDYRRLRAYTPFAYGIVITLLVVVVSPFGTTINGAKAWIQMPAGFTIQPGEFAKIVVILALALVFSERDVMRRAPSDHDVRQALIWAAIPVALIMLQPDLGTVLIIGSVVIGIIVIANSSSKWVIGLIGAVALAALFAMATGILDQYQLDRLLTFTDPSRDPQGIGYNTTQARIAIGGGGLFGQGLFNGHQTQGAFVPYQQTDIVFSVAGEEHGLVGSTIVIALVGVVLWRGLQIARAARDPFGRLIAVGVVCWFGFQSFENIGMNLGIMPVTGVPLPFVSYGGTSMFAAWIGIGLLQSVHMRSRQ